MFNGDVGIDAYDVYLTVFYFQTLEKIMDIMTNWNQLMFDLHKIIMCHNVYIPLFVRQTDHDDGGKSRPYNI